ncbi:hypothetical protein PFLUOLIPICF7_05415 [Pseudomonas simiae]|nr:hypothetical protein PFLUOLIPICF7_05415 [Pseudomonas simiae]
MEIDTLDMKARRQPRKQPPTRPAAEFDELRFTGDVSPLNSTLQNQHMQPVLRLALDTSGSVVEYLVPGGKHWPAVELHGGRLERLVRFPITRNISHRSTPCSVG